MRIYSTASALIRFWRRCRRRKFYKEISIAVVMWPLRPGAEQPHGDSETAVAAETGNYGSCLLPNYHSTVFLKVMCNITEIYPAAEAFTNFI